jgi:hypothetical protein
LKTKFKEKKLSRLYINTIFVSVLSSYLSWPILFLIKAQLHEFKYKKNLVGTWPKEFLNLVAPMANMYVLLSKQIGRQMAFEVMRVGVISTEILLDHKNFFPIENGRSFEKLKNGLKEALVSGITRWNKAKVIVDSDSKFEMRFTYCIFDDFFRQQNIPEFTQIICSHANAVFNSYMPEEIIQHRNGIGNRLSANAPECHQVIENMKIK